MSVTGMVVLVCSVVVVGLVCWAVHRCTERRKASEAELSRLEDQLIQCDERLGILADELERYTGIKSE